jgi:hypothetical protein
VAKIFDCIEIGLTKSELRQALRAWMDRKTMINNYQITNVSLHPQAEYMVRFTVEPPLEKADKEKISDARSDSDNAEAV